MAYSFGFSQSLEILFYIKLKTEMEEEKYLTIQQISKKTNIPIPSLKRLVGLLKKSDFLASKKGLNGGLALAKSADRIRLYDVFTAIEGTTPLFKQYDNFDVSAFKHKKEVTYMLTESKKIFENAEQSMLDELKKKTLADLFVE